MGAAALGVAVTLAPVAFALAGCAQKRSPTEEIGDTFVDHYLKADQEGALPFTALGASSQLQRELKDAKEARGEGATPDIDARFQRVSEETRERRAVLVYDVTSGGKDAAKRTMRLELADLGQGPKVVLYELH